jgi:hypothetical protein
MRILLALILALCLCGCATYDSLPDWQKTALWIGGGALVAYAASESGGDGQPAPVDRCYTIRPPGTIVEIICSP